MTDNIARLTAALSERYRLERELGAGGMATVYLAHDLRHDRSVAIKVLRSELAAVIGSERFLREIRLTASLNHPHILPLLDSGQADELLFYVMPLVEGESLRVRLDREGKLPLNDSLLITRECADALGYAHSRGIIHRDIKPENILLHSGHAVVADFGIARAMDAAAGTRLTETGLAIGTPAYMSPEQAMGEPVDGRSDIYALGCVVYEMLAGQPPHSGPTPQAILAYRLSKPVTPIRQLRPSVSLEVENALQHALAPVPQDRPATASQFIAELPGPPPITAQVSASRRTRRVGLGMALVLLLAVIAWVVSSRGKQPAPVASASTGTVLAVLPFEVIGLDSTVWRWGIADLLSADLEGVGNLRPMSSRTVESHWRSVRVEDQSGSPGGLDVARRLGAHYAIAGSMINSGTTLRINATLFDTRSARAVGSAASVEGPSDSIPALVDRLTIALLRGTPLVSEVESLPRFSLSRITTTSLPALKAYIAGDEFYHRSRLREAVVDLNRAVELDSTFALAYARLALTQGWLGHWGELVGYARKAEQFSTHLPERDRQLLLGLKLLAIDNPASIATLEEYTRRYPDDAEGWALLGEAYFDHSSLLLQPMDRFRTAFSRAIDLSPYFGPGYFRMISDGFFRRDSAGLRTLLDGYRKIDAQADWCVGNEVAYSLAFGDTTKRRWALDIMDTLGATPSEPIGCTAYDLTMSPDYHENLDLVVNSILRPSRRPEEKALGELYQVYDLIQQGRVREAQAALSRMVASRKDPTAMDLQVMLHVAHYPDTAAVRPIRQWLLADSTRDPFMVGVLAVSTGNDAEFRWGIRQLEQQGRRLIAEGDTVEGSRKRAFGRALQMYGELQRAPSIKAARELSQLLPEVGSSSRLIRYQLVRAFLELGQADEAERVLAGFNPEELAGEYIVIVEYNRGRAAEELGKDAEARQHYERFIRWWAHADPELQPWVQDARSRLARLSGEPMQTSP